MSGSRTQSSTKTKEKTFSGLNLDLISLNSLDQLEQLIHGLMAQLRQLNEEKEELRRFSESQRTGKDSQLERQQAELLEKEETVRRLNLVLSHKESAFQELQAVVEKQRLELRRMGQAKTAEAPMSSNNQAGEARSQEGVRLRIQAALKKLDELEKIVTTE